jgi:hypothetical protein
MRRMTLLAYPREDSSAFGTELDRIIAASVDAAHVPFDLVVPGLREGA